MDTENLTSRFRRVFSQRHVILPVIHVANEGQALRNAKVAREAGTDGVFLINHGISHRQLLSIHQAVVAEHGDWWIGVNCLDLFPTDVFQHIGDDVSGVWVDNATINESQSFQSEAEYVLKVRQEAAWPGLYFGGVAFKGQRIVDDPAAAAVKAAPYMDVVTTSGPGTGRAAPVEKIRTMKQALGSFPLAIASGITPANVIDYFDCADCFLVATGVSRSFHELDLMSLIELVGTVRSNT